VKTELNGEQNAVGMLCLAARIAVAMALATTGLGLAACGSGGHVATSQSSAASTSMILPTTNTTPATSSRLRGDEDDDDVGIPNKQPGQPSDSDADVDNDYQDLVKKGYYDSDDKVRRDYGHAPSPAQRRVLTRLVENYFAAAVKEDGKRACALLLPSFASSMPEDYGSQTPGSSYLRGAKTCAAVLSGVFQHEHAVLSAPVKVVDVRVEGAQGIALLGSTTISARTLDLARQGGVWRIQGVLGVPMP
jgi:hypothetical protein